MAQMWIDGRRTDAADGRVFDVVNPATEEVIDYVIGAKPYWYPYRFDRPPGERR